MQHLESRHRLAIGIVRMQPQSPGRNRPDSPAAAPSARRIPARSSFPRPVHEHACGLEDAGVVARHVAQERDAVLPAAGASHAGAQRSVALRSAKPPSQSRARASRACALEPKLGRESGRPPERDSPACRSQPFEHRTRRRAASAFPFDAAARRARRPPMRILGSPADPRYRSAAARCADRGLRHRLSRSHRLANSLKVSVGPFDAEQFGRRPRAALRPMLRSWQMRAAAAALAPKIYKTAGAERGQSADDRQSPRRHPASRRTRKCARRCRRRPPPQISDAVDDARGGSARLLAAEIKCEGAAKIRIRTEQAEGDGADGEQRHQSIRSRWSAWSSAPAAPRRRRSGR